MNSLNRIHDKVTYWIDFNDFGNQEKSEIDRADEYIAFINFLWVDWDWLEPYRIKFHLTVYLMIIIN